VTLLLASPLLKHNALSLNSGGLLFKAAEMQLQGAPSWISALRTILTHSQGGLPRVRDETGAFSYGLIPSALIKRIKTAFILLEKQKNWACGTLIRCRRKSSLFSDF
jgi:hypothetical protein